MIGLCREKQQRRVRKKPRTKPTKKATPRARREKEMIVGITGATCSGKTRLAVQLGNQFKNCIVIHQDEFYKVLNQ
jgi:adenylylsulfate kinase-like enzyme